ncbi:MAG: hypothetical protein WCH21_02230 [Bacteroidota bacterium]
MITQNLVDLINSGKAQFRNWTTGGTASSRIPVPKNNYIVITDFTYHHFAGRFLNNTTDEEIIKNAFDNCVNNLRFNSFGQDYAYTIRSGFNITRPIVGNSVVINFPNGDTKYDCYQVHKTDVHVDLWRFPNLDTWVLNGGNLSDKTSEGRAPYGYGTAPMNPPAFPVQRSIDFLGATFVPYGENQGIPLPANWRETFHSDINFNTILFPPAINDVDGQFTYPLINISYVLVNMPFDKNDR